MHLELIEAATHVPAGVAPFWQRVVEVGLGRGPEWEEIENRPGMFAGPVKAPNCIRLHYLIAICFGFAVAVLVRCTSRMPSLKLALIFSGSTLRGSANDRSNLP